MKQAIQVLRVLPPTLLFLAGASAGIAWVLLELLARLGGTL